jgi:TP901 family phage tail tape measure protein
MVDKGNGLVEKLKLNLSGLIDNGSNDVDSMERLFAVVREQELKPNDNITKQSNLYREITTTLQNIYSIKTRLLTSDENLTVELQKQLNEQQKRLTVLNNDKTVNHLEDTKLENDLLNVQLKLQNDLTRIVANRKDLEVKADVQSAYNNQLKYLREIYDYEEKIIQLDKSNTNGGYNNTIKELEAKLLIASDNLALAQQNINDNGLEDEQLKIKYLQEEANLQDRIRLLVTQTNDTKNIKNSEQLQATLYKQQESSLNRLYQLKNEEFKATQKGYQEEVNYVQQLIQKEEQYIASIREEISVNNVTDNNKEINLKQKELQLEENLVKVTKQKGDVDRINAELAERNYAKLYGQKNQNIQFIGTSDVDLENYAKQFAGIHEILSTKLIKDFDDTGKAINSVRVTFRTATNETQTFKLTADSATKSIYQLKEATNTPSSRELGFIGMLKTAMEKFPVWMAATTVFMQAVHAIQAGIKYVVDMDNAMVSLAKVVDLSTESMDGLRQSAIEMGKALGKSSVDVMNSYAEIARVYKNPEEIKEIGRVALMASNVTSMSAQEAAKSINTMLITYKLGVKDAASVLDSLNEIQNNYRTNAEDLMEGIGKVGAAAKQAGISVQQLEGYTVALVSATGISGDEAGTAIKSMISRMFRIGSEGEEDAGKSEATLKQLGIAVRDVQGQFRAFDDILRDISIAWTDWDNVTRQNVAQVVAGTYHYSKFINLIENYNLATKATTTALISQGSAIKENQKYLDSIEGRLQTLGTTVQNTFSEFIKADSIKSLVSILTYLVDTFANLKTIMGVALTALLMWKGATILSGETLSVLATNVINLGFQFKNLGASLSTLKAAYIENQMVTNGLTYAQATARFSTVALSASLKGLWAVFMANPLAWIIGIWTAVTLVIDIHNKKVREAKEAAEKYNESIKQQQGALSSLRDEYDKLIMSNEQDSTTKNRLIEIQKQLIDTYGIEADKLDLVNGKYLDQIKIIDEAIAKKSHAYVTANTVAYNDALKQNTDELYRNFGNNSNNPNANALVRQAIIDATGQDLEKQKLSLKEYQKALDDVINKQQEYKIQNSKKFVGDNYFADLTKEYNQVSQALSDNQTILDKYIENQNVESFYNDFSSKIALVKDEIVKLNQTTDETAKAKILDNLKKYKNEFIEIANQLGKTNEYAPLVEQLFNNVKFNDNIAPSADSIKSFEELAKSVKSVIADIKDLNDIQSDLANGNKLTADSMLDLLIKFPELINYIHATADGYTIEKDGLILVKQALIDNEIQTLKSQSGITDAITKNLTVRLQAYGIELSSIKNLADAQNAFALLTESAFRSNDKDAQARLAEQKKALETIAELNTLQEMLEKGLKETKIKSSSTPADIAMENNTDAYIRGFNAQVENDKILSQSLEKQIKITDSAKEYVKYVELSQKLLENQKKTQNDLILANQKINAEANRLRSNSSYGKVSETWFDTNGNDTKAYGDLINQLAEQANKSTGKTRDNLVNERKAVIELHDSLSALKKQWFENADAQNAMDDSISSTQANIESLIKTQIKSTLEIEKKNQLISAENEYNKKLRQAEENIYGQNNSQSEYEEQVKLRINSLQAEIDALEDKNALEAEDEERQKRKLEIQKLQEELQNTINNKNVQILQKKLDGSWDYAYTYDNEKVDKINTQIIDKQKELNDWEDDLRKKHEVEKLKDTIKSEQDLMEAKRLAYEAQKKVLDLSLEAEKASIEAHFINLDNMVTNDMEMLKGIYGNKWDEIIKLIKEKLDSAKLLNGTLEAELEKTAQLAADIAKANAEKDANIATQNANSTSQVSGISHSVSSQDKSALNQLLKAKQLYDAGKKDDAANLAKSARANMSLETLNTVGSATDGMNTSELKNISNH